METRFVELPTPDAYLSLAACNVSQAPWVFEGRDLEGASALWRAVGISAGDVARLRALAHCDGSGCSVVPDAALVGSMSVETRSTLYRELQRYPSNNMHAFPSYRPAELGRWSEIPGLSPPLRALLARTAWREPGRESYSDHAWLCAQLPSDEARLEAIRVFYRRYALDAWVRVPQSGDIEPIVRYWSPGRGEDAVRRLLGEARAAGGSGRVAVRELLPTFARTHLGRFPTPDAPEFDCFWSSVHFFDGASPPDDRPGQDGMAELLRAAYREIAEREVRLGDVAVHFPGDGLPVHASNVVTRDILFTKNGRDHTRPWVLQSRAFVQRGYPFTQIRYFRRR